MDGRRRDSRKSRGGTPAAALRQRLEPLEMEGQQAMDERPRLSRASTSFLSGQSRLLPSDSRASDWHGDDDAPSPGVVRAPTDPPDGLGGSTATRAHPGGHVRFSDELGHHSGAAGQSQTQKRSGDHDPRDFRVDTSLGLYTAPSDAEPSDLQRGRMMQRIAGAIQEESPQTRPGGVRCDAEGLRDSGFSIPETPISLTRPRHRFGGFDENIKSAVTMAETNATLAHYRDWVARQRERQRKWTQGPTGRLKKKASALYKAYIAEGLLRQKPLPPSADGRHIPLTPRFVGKKQLTDERTGRPYVSNFIRSSRYTLWNFLPNQLFFQFSKLANFYFLVIGLLQIIPGLSTTGKYTTIGPLLAFVAISMAKEGYDDYRRYKLDKVENRSEASVLDPAQTIKPSSRGRIGGVRSNLKKKRKSADCGGEMAMTELQGGAFSSEKDPWSRAKWQDLRVGDMIRLRRDENVPADIVLLHATGPNGVAYIETMALDGETNLKTKQACPLLADHCDSLTGMRSCDAEIVSEDPNLDLYNFEGRATVNGSTMPLTTSEVVYRGSTLRNTDQAIGLVVNTGEECKIRMNANKNVHAKAPKMQYKVNKVVIFLVFFVIMLSVGCTIGYEQWRSRYENMAWYLNGSDVPFKQIIIGFIIEFNTLIPLSLYVSLEIIKIGQLLLLADVDMYDPETDTPMVSNTTTIMENLGQVGYVFSDKTGTLTENLMRFRKMSVAGTAWLHDMDVARTDEQERQGEDGTRGLAEEGEARKGNGKQATRTSTTVRPVTMASADTLETSIDEPLIEHVRDEARPPKKSTSSVPWQSTVRPSTGQPEPKTDDLIRYLRRRPHTAFSRKARHFILCIALCHTCLPETKKNGEVDFQAASPDELALVEAARDLGYLMVDRAAQSIRLRCQDFDGSYITETYELLDVIEFSSTRKRMSVIARMPDGRTCVFTKGADSVILPRLRLNNLALQKASAVERRASRRKSVEQEKALARRSMHATPKDSMNLVRAASTMTSRKGGLRSSLTHRRSEAATDEVNTWLSRREAEEFDPHRADDEAYQTPRQSLPLRRSADLVMSPTTGYGEDDLVDESLAVNEGAIFERCFQHIDDFASEGLRTLLFASRYLDDDDYKKWKTIYHEAATSLVNRQDRIEAAADLVEQNFDLAGATAIEDKLQRGVPETIDKLRRANIKVWMLTGDKRETAINIAHSARICKPFSELYILDCAEDNLQDQIASTLIEVGRGMVPHSVVVIDGQTLGIVEADESLRAVFFDLVARVDSVICCRASPSQKATLVKCIRNQVPGTLTLAIGDGANDISMIQASHVGIGISGREGLQAARISDYSIAQFRFLQRLLFVHGRWNYIRTGKYVLGTFWKELLFYLVQALYQRYNGYTGTSLYESTSLAVFNTLFTSLPVIIVGMFEQDLHPKTLLAVPELYTFGQRDRAFNFKQYIAWMIMSVIEAIIIYYLIYGMYINLQFTDDTTLFAMGDMAFTVCVVFINIKMLVLELHHKTVVSFIGLFISVGGWFLWNIFLSAIYPEVPGPYMVHAEFISHFGRKPSWWLTALAALSTVVLLELLVSSVRRVWWPRDQDLMQEIERYAGVMDIMKEHAAERGEASGPEAVAPGADGVGEKTKVASDDDDDDDNDDEEDDDDEGYDEDTTVRSSMSPAPPAGASSSSSSSWREGRIGAVGDVARSSSEQKSGSRRLGENHVPPPFTPLVEERDDSMSAVADPSTGGNAKEEAAAPVL